MKSFTSLKTTVLKYQKGSFIEKLIKKHFFCFYALLNGFLYNGDQIENVFHWRASKIKYGKNEELGHGNHELTSLPHTIN